MKFTVALACLLAGCASAAPTPPAPPGELVLEMYQVSEWVRCGGSFAGCDMKDIPQGCDEFLANLKAAVTPSPWDEEGWALGVQNGLLIVRASRSVQDEVLAYVTGLRSASVK